MAQWLMSQLKIEVGGGGGGFVPHRKHGACPSAVLVKPRKRPDITKKIVDRDAKALA